VFQKISFGHISERTISKSFLKGVKQSSSKMMGCRKKFVGCRKKQSRLNP